jgi:hypothetical protein
MKTLVAFASVGIVLMFISAIFFVTSEVVQLAVGQGIQSLLSDTLSLSVAFSILSIIVARLSSNQMKSKHAKNRY